MSSRVGYSGAMSGSIHVDTADAVGRPALLTVDVDHVAWVRGDSMTVAAGGIAGTAAAADIFLTDPESIWNELLHRHSFVDVDTTMDGYGPVLINSNQYRGLDGGHMLVEFAGEVVRFEASDPGSADQRLTATREAMARYQAEVN